MNTILALISGQALIHALVYLIVIALIFWVLWWLLGYIGLPEPFNKVIRIILGVAVAIFLINFLLGLVGSPFIQW